MPTIYNMIEALDREAANLHLVLTCKDGNVDWPDRRDRIVAVSGLKAKPLVLAGVARFPRVLGRLRRPLRDLWQIWRIWRLAKELRPGVIYLDHANVFAAGLLARTAVAPVVFRVMGIYPIMRRATTGAGRRGGLLRWCYRAPFVQVICTQDGSGVEPWLQSALRRNVPREVMINGLDIEKAPLPDSRLKVLPGDRTVVTFLGKLEPEKGAEEFVRAFLRATQEAPGRLHALIVGAGSLEAPIRRRIQTAGAQSDVTLIGRLAHEQVINALERTDIYVSVNRLGNLSNANLEAMTLGCCMVIPAAQPDTGIDLVTDRLLPPDAALRIGGTDDIDGLADAILTLHGDAKQRAARGAAAKRAAGSFIPTWDTRIAQELALISRVEACPQNLTPGEAPHA